MPQIDYSVVSSLASWSSILFVMFYFVFVCFILPLVLFLLKIRREFVLILVFYKNQLDKFKALLKCNIYKLGFIESFCNHVISAFVVWPKEKIQLALTLRNKTKLRFLRLIKALKLEILLKVK